MGRLKRVHMPGTVVHVVQRCHNKRFLLRDAADKEAYLAALAETAAELDYEVISYCIQDNHVHDLLRTPAVIRGHTLSAFMQKLNGRFSHRYNAAHGRLGTVWCSRFQEKWLPGVSALRLLKLIWYVEGNIQRRTVGATPAEDWPWCSAYWYFRGQEGPVMTVLGPTLETLLSRVPNRPHPADFLRLVLQAPTGAAWRQHIPHTGELWQDYSRQSESGDPLERREIIHRRREVIRPTDRIRLIEQRAERCQAPHKGLIVN